MQDFNIAVIGQRWDLYRIFLGEQVVNTHSSRIYQTTLGQLNNIYVFPSLDTDESQFIKDYITTFIDEVINSFSCVILLSHIAHTVLEDEDKIVKGLSQAGKILIRCARFNDKVPEHHKSMNVHTFSINGDVHSKIYDAINEERENTHDHDNPRQPFMQT